MNTRSLHYQIATKWEPIPRWCSYFIELGRALTQTSVHEERRLVVALSVPSRAYAAAFLAASFVSKRSTIANKIADSAEHFRQLCELPSGTSLFYRDKAHRYKAFLEGVESIDGKLMVKIRTEKNLVRYLPPALAQGVSISPVEFSSLPKHQAGHFVAPESPFFREFVDDNCNTSLVLQSRLDCVIVGSAAVLREEIVGTPLAFQAQSGSITGTLDCILRVRRFNGVTAIFRSDILPVSAVIEDDTERYAAPLAIFDGSSSFMRWQSVCARPMSIAILDRTDAKFTEAIDLFNQGYSMRTNDATIVNMPDSPRGIEIAAYEAVLL